MKKLAIDAASSRPSVDANRAPYRIADFAVVKRAVLPGVAERAGKIGNLPLEVLRELAEVMNGSEPHEQGPNLRIGKTQGLSDCRNESMPGVGEAGCHCGDIEAVQHDGVPSQMTFDRLSFTPKAQRGISNWNV